MTTTSEQWTEQSVQIAGERIHVLTAGTGEPLLVLHHDFGNPGPLAFHEQLARQFTVVLPSHPGYEGSDRPAWMRSVADVAKAYQWLLKDLRLEAPSLVGLGFGGWIAAEMATMSPRQFRRLVLVGAMGIQPPRGEILDQSLINTMEYIKAGFHDPARFDAIFSEPDTDQLERWEINREMTFRIAWKPYMYSQTLPHLLGGVRAPALVVWGEHDKVVPRGAGEIYAARLPDARLDLVPACGHCVEMEKPQELVRLVTMFCNRG